MIVNFSRLTTGRRTSHDVTEMKNRILNLTILALAAALFASCAVEHQTTTTTTATTKRRAVTTGSNLH